MVRSGQPVRAILGLRVRFGAAHAQILTEPWFRFRQSVTAAAPHRPALFLLLPGRARSLLFLSCEEKFATACERLESKSWLVIGLLRCGFALSISKRRSDIFTQTFSFLGPETRRPSELHQCHRGIRDEWSSEPRPHYERRSGQLFRWYDKILQSGPQQTKSVSIHVLNVLSFKDIQHPRRAPTVRRECVVDWRLALSVAE